eukprot:g11839.t1
MSEPTNYHKEILKDFHREYGAGSVLPECVRDCIRFTSDSGIEELMAKNRYVARMMLRVHEDLYELEQLEHMQFPQHLMQLYRDKRFLFMEKLARWAINDSPELQGRRAEILSIFDKMKKGLSTRGEISPSGFWRLLPEGQQAANRREAEEEAQTQKSRKPYDHWASEQQIEEMLRQTEKNIAKGIWRVLNIAQDGAEAKKVFPVEQGNKTRLCCDFRMHNLMLFALEKMRMLGVRATQEVMARCMSPFADQCSLTAFKSDLKADVETEKQNREATKQSATDEAVARYKADFNFLVSSAQKLETRIEETVLGGESFSFIPFSKVHMLIVSRILKVITTIYIDDLHSHSRELMVAQDAELISLYLSLAGWPETVEKSESHDRVRQRSLVVLGIAYELGPDARWISMSVDPTRIARLLDMGKTLKQQLVSKKVEFDLLDSFKGLLRHVAQLVPTFNHLVRGLDCWTVEEYFQAHIRCEKERRALGALISLLLSCVPFAQKVQLNPTFFDMPIAHVYSDAAVENVKELSALLKTGVRTGLQRFKMKIGALLVKPDGETEFFSCDIDSLPGFCDRMHIGVLECLACRIASQAFAKCLKDSDGVYHVDNLGAASSDVMEVASDVLPSVAETGKIISATDVIDLMENLVNEAPITGACKDEACRNLITKGTKHGYGIYGGPTLPQSLSYEKYRAFTTAGNLLPKQDVSVDNDGPKVVLERLQCNQKAALMGEQSPDAFKVPPPSTKQLSDAGLAMKGMIEYFNQPNYSHCVIGKDLAVMNLTTVHQFAECSIHALCGSGNAWLGADGTPRKFLEEQKTVRVDEDGELFVYKVATDTLVPIPRHCSAARDSLNTTMNTSRSGPYSQAEGASSSSSRNVGSSSLSRSSAVPAPQVSAMPGVGLNRINTRPGPSAVVAQQYIDQQGESAKGDENQG